MKPKRYTDYLKQEIGRVSVRNKSTSYLNYLHHAKKIKRNKMVYREIYENPN